MTVESPTSVPLLTTRSTVKLSMVNTARQDAIVRKTLSGSNKTVRRSISSAVCGPCFHCLIELTPTRFLTVMGIYLTRRSVVSMAKVVVVENEKPRGMRCRYFFSIGRLTIRRPEFRSGICSSAR